MVHVRVHVKEVVPCYSAVADRSSLQGFVLK